MIIALDFDGTLATHEWPDVGNDIGAFPWLIDLQNLYSGKNLRYILWTVRSQKPLSDAINFCANNGLSFWDVNINPTQHLWSPSNKAHAHVYVDDAALGAPLIYPENGYRPYVDWDRMGPMLIGRVAYYFSLKDKIHEDKNE